jgi:predicted 3-demethylubiquinone-9 3-methyltransferase (glyoxalase superfamily)
VTCEGEQEIDTLYAELSKDGEIFMPLNAYPFSAKYAWIADRYGVSWQLSLLDSAPSS